ncbi:hypothetical protein CWI33_16085 [Escherichia coli]|nr:hypothetical protein CWI33_16085 [Escherichia coli]
MVRKYNKLSRDALKMLLDGVSSRKVKQYLVSKKIGYTDLMVDGAPLPHQPDTIIRWLIDRPRS